MLHLFYFGWPASLNMRCPFLFHNLVLIVSLDEYQTLDPAVSRATNYGLPRDCETYYQTSRHLNNDHRSQMQPQIQVQTEWDMEGQRTTAQSDANGIGGSVGSLEFIKTPFGDDDREVDDAFPEPPKMANSNSTLGRSRTLNFPKATFV